MALTLRVLPTSPPLSTSYQIISVVVVAASEGEVNEGISHETLTGGPIMRAAVADKDGGEDTSQKGLSINEMGHHMNVECALSTARKRKCLRYGCFRRPRPLSCTIEENWPP